MYKEILQTITGVHVFPVISLILFVAVFGAVLVKVARMDSHRVSRLASLPLDGPAMSERNDLSDTCCPSTSAVSSPSLRTPSALAHSARASNGDLEKEGVR
jgi:hypothetical protein